MRELSLFTGAGGGLLGTMLLGWRCVGAVEWESYPCRVLEQRQKDGVLDDFPIWNMDIREFNRRIAPSYTGLVDVVSAGFPCQPFSLAGKRGGANDERNMWPATIECIRVVQPRFALLENVPGLLTSGYFGKILGDLAESGYDARWRILSAAEVGAPHRRNRLWIVADAQKQRMERPSWEDWKQNWNRQKWMDSIGSGANVADADSGSLVRITEPREECSGWTVEPDVGRVANGVAARVDRLKAIGNGQVPAVVAAVWQLLSA